MGELRILSRITPLSGPRLRQTNSCWVLSPTDILPLSPIPQNLRCLLIISQLLSMQHEDFVFKSIAEGLKNGCMRLVSEKPSVVNPLSVAVQSNGKKRLICDLRHVNKSLKTQKFKMDDMNSAIPAFSKGAYAFTFDLKKGYYHVNLHPKCQTFFGFSFTFNGEKHYAVYTVGPFGLATMPWLFTKLLKPWVRRWRALGYHIYLFLDDGIGIALDFRTAWELSNLVRGDLLRAGIMEQPPKCFWMPKKWADWLGLSVDFEKFELIIPADRVERALGAITDALKGKTSPKGLLRAAGHLISFAIVLGKNVFIKTKPLYQEAIMHVQARRDWAKTFTISEEAVKCLEFWRDNLPLIDHRKSLLRKPVSCIMFSDASATAGAAFVQKIGPADGNEPVILRETNIGLDFKSPLECTRQTSELIALTQFNECEKKESSTWRELKAIHHSLESLGPTLQGRGLKYFSDNLGGTSIVRKGSMIKGLNSLAESIAGVCDRYDIQLELKWIRRNHNKIADKLSRWVDWDDWGINQTLFESIEKHWGPFSVDRFATDKNSKLRRFNSRFCCPGSEAIDAFAQNWAGEENWLVPPPGLVSETVRHLLETKATGVLVAPAWRSAKFWPFLFPQGNWAWFLKDFYLVHQGGKFLVEGSQPKSIFSPDKFKGELIVARLNATCR